MNEVRDLHVKTLGKGIPDRGIVSCSSPETRAVAAGAPEGGTEATRGQRHVAREGARCFTIIIIINYCHC